MRSGITVPDEHYVALVKLAARNSSSVETVVGEAIAAYLADVDCGLLLGPRGVPRYDLRLRTRLEVGGRGGIAGGSGLSRSG